MYIINNGDETYSITDDGATISDLQLGGFDFSTSARTKIYIRSNCICTWSDKNG